jgi:hypothetical protein
MFGVVDALTPAVWFIHGQGFCRSRKPRTLFMSLADRKGIIFGVSSRAIGASGTSLGWLPSNPPSRGGRLELRRKGQRTRWDAHVDCRLRIPCGYSQRRRGFVLPSASAFVVFPLLMCNGIISRIPNDREAVTALRVLFPLYRPTRWTWLLIVYVLAPAGGGCRLAVNM